MPHRVRRLTPSIRLVSVLAVLLAVGCGGGDDPTGPGDVPQTLDITLAVAEGTPGDLVKITGLPADITGLYGETRVPAAASLGGAQEDPASVASILREPGGDDYLVLPLHPMTPLDGGTVDIHVTDGANVTSNTVSVTLQGLTPAPGAYAEVVSHLQLLLDAWLGQLGTTREALRSAPVASLPLTQAAILFVHNVVDSPDNPNSLRALADGDIPLFADTPVDRDLLDAITAEARLLEWVDEKLAFADTLAPPAPAPVATVGMGSAEAKQAGCIDAPTFDIGNDCGLLSELMSYQTGIEFARTSASRKVERDVAGAVLAAGSLTGAAPVAAGVSSTIWAIDTIDDGSAGLYPSRFVNDATDFVASKEQFPEDFTTPGNWSEFQVTAVSEGWRFDDKIVEAVEQMATAGKGFDASPAGSISDIRSGVEGMVKNQANQTLKQTMLDNNPGTLEYCPQTWSGIDCTGLPYSEGSSPSLEVDPANLSYKPTEVGKTTLRVETLPVFGIGKSTGETKEIETQMLEVFIDPFQATLGTDVDQTFTARVQGAENQDVEWTCTWNEFTSGGMQADLKTPSDPWDPAIEVTAKSLSNTGLRKDKVDSDPRTKKALVTHGEDVLLFVTPEFVCLNGGETQQFTAEVIGLQDYTVLWNVVQGPGTIGANGLYQAPTTSTGEATISAELEGVPDVIAYAEITVGACTCYANINVSGSSSLVTRTSDIVYMTTPVPDLAYQFLIDTGSGDQGIGLAFVGGDGNPPSPRPGDVGTWEASFSYAAGSKIWIANPGSEDAGVTVTVFELTDSYMVGQVSGTAATYDNLGQVESTVSVSIDFRAGYFDGTNAPCN